MSKREEFENLNDDLTAAKAEIERLRGRVATLEMIGSSLLHGHKMSEVDWKAFKALDKYFEIHHPKGKLGGDDE